ncbi:MAG TPA: OmpH family outer membrane protein, partial [Bryobacteraceae bacterium]|nr:OmpH family outer membrane protein [Bryobacteraceae bacterium]
QRGARNLQHDVDDLNAELQQEEGKIMQDMAVKMDELIQKYARKNGFGMVLDVSSQQTPVLWADAGSNITAEIVKEYDAAYPAKAAVPAAAAAPKTGAK